MAVTYAIQKGGTKAKRWIVTWALDSDTTITIPHGFNGIPDNVYIIPLTPQAYTGQVCKTPLPDVNNIYLAKTTAATSGGAQVEVIAYIPNSSL